MVRKITDINLFSDTDRYMIKNGFFKLTKDPHDGYTIIYPTAKWTKLAHTVLRQCVKVEDGKVYHTIPTVELVMKTIKTKELKRNPYEGGYISKEKKKNRKWY